MVRRYAINNEFVFDDCLVTPSAYEGVLQRFDEFITPYVAHLHARSHQQKACDDMKGLLSDTERKNIEAISYKEIFQWTKQPIKERCISRRNNVPPATTSHYGSSKYLSNAATFRNLSSSETANAGRFAFSKILNPSRSTGNRSFSNAHRGSAKKRKNSRRFFRSHPLTP